MASDHRTPEGLQTHIAHAQVHAPPTLESPVPKGTATRRRRTSRRGEGSTPGWLPRPRQALQAQSGARQRWREPQGAAAPAGT
eukprot:1219624-Pyramimonas_sp.AAC.1